MSKICYVSKKFNEEHADIIRQANSFIVKYQNAGYSLTLRQLYYQFVSKDAFPQSWADPATGSTNNERSYKKLGDIICAARLAGLIDWTAIEDRTRDVVLPRAWDSPQSIIAACASQYQIDLWDNQQNYVEVWVEKDAMVSVIAKASEQLRLPYFSCRGFSSATSIWDAAQRIQARVESITGEAIILHLGDHDPSGVDMTRDIAHRLKLFRTDVTVRRIALQMHQVEEFDLPPNPAKVTDSRARKYIDQFGEECWELDALEPSYIVDLIETHASEFIDDDVRQADLETEAKQRKQILGVSRAWNKIVSDQSTEDDIDDEESDNYDVDE